MGDVEMFSNELCDESEHILSDGEDAEEGLVIYEPDRITSRRIMLHTSQTFSSGLLVTQSKELTARTKARIASRKKGTGNILSTAQMLELQNFQKNRALSINTRVTCAIGAWVVWIVSGTIFYALHDQYGWSYGYYMSVNVGWSIAWPIDPHYPPPYSTPLSKIFTSLHASIGVFFLVMIVVFIAEQLAARRENWMVNIRRQKELAASTKNQNIVDMIYSYVAFYAPQHKAVLLFLVWWILGVVWFSCSVDGWTVWNALDFTVSTLTGSGYSTIPHSSPSSQYVVVAFYGNIGMPLMAVALGLVASRLMFASDELEMFRKIMAKITPSEIRFMKQFGIDDGDGSIDAKEYVILIVVRIGAVPPQVIGKLKQRFHELDIKGEGGIDYSELLFGGKKANVKQRFTTAVQKLLLASSTGAQALHRAVSLSVSRPRSQRRASTKKSSNGRGRVYCVQQSSDYSVNSQQSMSNIPLSPADSTPHDQHSFFFETNAIENDVESGSIGNDYDDTGHDEIPSGNERVDVSMEILQNTTNVPPSSDLSIPSQASVLNKCNSIDFDAKSGSNEYDENWDMDSTYCGSKAPIQLSPLAKALQCTIVRQFSSTDNISHAPERPLLPAIIKRRESSIDSVASETNDCATSSYSHVVVSEQNNCSHQVSVNVQSVPAVESMPKHLNGGTAKEIPDCKSARSISDHPAVEGVQCSLPIEGKTSAHESKAVVKQTSESGTTPDRMIHRPEGEVNSSIDTQQQPGKRRGSVNHIGITTNTQHGKRRESVNRIDIHDVANAAKRQRRLSVEFHSRNAKSIRRMTVKNILVQSFRRGFPPDKSICAMVLQSIRDAFLYDHYFQAFCAWCVWIIAGTMFYAFTEHVSFSKGFYLSVSIGFSIFWMDVHKAAYTHAYSIFHLLVGSVATAVIMAFCAMLFSDLKNDWWVHEGRPWFVKKLVDLHVKVRTRYKFFLTFFSGPDASEKNCRKSERVRTPLKKPGEKVRSLDAWKFGVKFRVPANYKY